ncbi:hypothetical protein Tco_1199716 [Tanacetum coccineum]
MLLQDVVAHAHAQAIPQAYSKPQAKATAHVQAQMVVMTLVRVIRRNRRLIRNYYQLTGQNKGKQYHATKQAMEVGLSCDTVRNEKVSKQGTDPLQSSATSSLAFFAAAK